MPARGKEFYLPYRPVIRETAETKTRIVCDASAKSHDSEPSVNDCLEIGPPLQNKLWQVLVRGHFYPTALAGDLRQAFLQVRIPLKIEMFSGSIGCPGKTHSLSALYISQEHSSVWPPHLCYWVVLSNII